LSECQPRRLRFLPTPLKPLRCSTPLRFRIMPNSHHLSQELERPLWPPVDRWGVYHTELYRLKGETLEAAAIQIADLEAAHHPESDRRSMKRWRRRRSLHPPYQT
jgi:hypothetical protein